MSSLDSKKRPVPPSTDIIQSPAGDKEHYKTKINAGVIFEDEGGGILTQRRQERSRKPRTLADDSNVTVTIGCSSDNDSEVVRSLHEPQKTENDDEPVDYELDTDNYHRGDGVDKPQANGLVYFKSTEHRPAALLSPLQPDLSSSQPDDASMGAGSPSSMRKRVTFSVEHSARDKDQEGAAVDNKQGRNNAVNGNQVDSQYCSSNEASGPSSISREPSKNSKDTDYSGGILTLDDMLRAKRRQDSKGGNNGGANHLNHHKHRRHRKGRPPRRQKAETLTEDEEARRRAKKDELAAAAAAAQRMPHRFFFVELIDPQINFLDTREHCSVITVAGRSTLEGKRAAVGVQPTGYTDIHGVVLNGFEPETSNEDENSGPSTFDNSSLLEEDIFDDVKPRIDPATGIAYVPKKAKRRVDLFLRMEGVSAFTVPTTNVWDNTANTTSSTQSTSDDTGGAGYSAAQEEFHPPSVVEWTLYTGRRWITLYRVILADITRERSPRLATRRWSQLRA